MIAYGTTLSYNSFLVKGDTPIRYTDMLHISLTITGPTADSTLKIINATVEFKGGPVDRCGEIFFFSDNLNIKNILSKILCIPLKQLLFYFSHDFD